MLRVWKIRMIVIFEMGCEEYKRKTVTLYSPIMDLEQVMSKIRTHYGNAESIEYLSCSMTTLDILE